MQWLLFLSQLPSQPSSLRVYVWRKLKSSGALGLQNGVWVLPDRPDMRAFLESLLAAIKEQKADGQIFVVSPISEEVEASMLARSRADRDEEYIEFIERGQAFLAEIRKETSVQKFTFAELEENEQDLKRLSGWLDKIRERDFFGGRQKAEAEDLLQTCLDTFETFAEQVYKNQSGADH